MNRLKAVFQLDTTKIRPLRGLVVVPLVILAAVPQEKYWVSFTFGALFVWLSDPGGRYPPRLRHTAGVAAVGALLTALGFGLGTAAWGWVVLVAFVVTLAGGLMVAYGMHRFTSGMLVNLWFLIALSESVSFQVAGVHTSAGAQTLAWLIGAAVTLAFTFILWLVRGRAEHQRPFADVMPGDTPAVPLTRPVVLFALIRALAVAITVAIAFGLHAPNADWMPVACLVAMRADLQQSELVAVERLAGTAIGAAAAALFLLTVHSKPALAIVLILSGALAAMLRAASYTWYCAAIAALVLIAMGLPHPTSLADEGRRVLYTFVGVGIAVLITLLANLLAKRQAARAQVKPVS